MAKGNNMLMGKKFIYLENEEINNKEEMEQINMQRDIMLKKNEKFMK